MGLSWNRKCELVKVSKKKKYMVVPRNQRVAEQGLQTSKGRLKFKGKSAMMVADESLASEIDTQHGLKGGSRDVYVYPDDRLATHERDEGGGVHHYFWGSSRRYSAGYDRIFRKERKYEDNE
jgi:hypothetical protein